MAQTCQNFETQGMTGDMKPVFHSTDTPFAGIFHDYQGLSNPKFLRLKSSNYCPTSSESLIWKACGGGMSPKMHLTKSRLLSFVNQVVVDFDRWP